MDYLAKQILQSGYLGLLNPIVTTKQWNAAVLMQIIENNVDDYELLDFSMQTSYNKGKYETEYT